MENLPNLMRQKVTQSRKYRGSQSRGTQRGPLRHIIIKMTKFQDKERILKTALEKQGAPIRLAADFSMENLQARREGKKYSK